MGGSWQMEVFRMALYVTFPVALFHYFNLPGNIEESVEKKRRQMVGPDYEKRQKQYKAMFEDLSKELS